MTRISGRGKGEPPLATRRHRGECSAGQLRMFLFHKVTEIFDTISFTRIECQIAGGAHSVFFLFSAFTVNKIQLAIQIRIISVRAPSPPRRRLEISRDWREKGGNIEQKTNV